MSVSIQFESDDGGPSVHHLASGTGWTDFRHWVDAIPNEYPSLKQLVYIGHTDDTLQLSNELKEAIDNHYPADLDIADIGEMLIENIGVGSSSETARVVH